jgi:hypothetical protein
MSADADAAKVGKVIQGLETEEAKVQGGECGQDPGCVETTQQKLQKLEAKLAKLEKRYQSVQYENRASGDQQYGSQLSTVRHGIQEAEYRIDRIVHASWTAAPRNIDIDAHIVPYPGAVQQFGTQDAAAEMTSDSVYQSDTMVDSIERAQSMEGKRSVYRALTHLRGATIAAYDGIARSHMKNVEEYAANHHWRSEHYVRHLAEEESDVSRWAFPVRYPRPDLTRHNVFSRNLDDPDGDPVFGAAPAPAAPLAPPAPAPLSEEALIAQRRPHVDAEGHGAVDALTVNRHFQEALRELEAKRSPRLV